MEAKGRARGHQPVGTLACNKYSPTFNQPYFCTIGRRKNAVSSHASHQHCALRDPGDCAPKPWDVQFYGTPSPQTYDRLVLL